MASTELFNKLLKRRAARDKRGAEQAVRLLCLTTCESERMIVWLRRRFEHHSWALGARQSAAALEMAARSSPVLPVRVSFAPSPDRCSSQPTRGGSQDLGRRKRSLDVSAGGRSARAAVCWLSPEFKRANCNDSGAGSHAARVQLSGLEALRPQGNLSHRVLFKRVFRPFDHVRGRLTLTCCAA